MIVRLCKRVMVLGLMLEMLLAMTAVEEGRHDLNWNVMICAKVGPDARYNEAEVRLRLRKSVASGPRELFKARKMTKDGRNEHTSDYLSVGIERRIGKIVWVRRAWMQRNAGGLLMSLRLERTQRSVKGRL